ncbi:MAG: hypothetical protein HY348_13405 [Nitrospira defluvii]|nr:hypothetical protein [Nitrospira defluvii]
MRTSLGNLPITVDPVTGRAKVVRGGVEGHAGHGLAFREPERLRPQAKPDKPVSSPALAPTFDSQLEADRDRYLYGLQLAGQIVRYVHHPFEVEIAPGRSYTPDFLVQWIGGHITVEEIKGNPKQKNARDSITRLHVAAAKLPMFQWQLITRVKRQWTIKWSI